MKRTILESIEGVEIYPIISLIIFMSLFAVVLLYIFRMDKGFIKKMSDLPLVNDHADEKEFSHETSEFNS